MKRLNIDFKSNENESWNFFCYKDASAKYGQNIPVRFKDVRVFVCLMVEWNHKGNIDCDFISFIYFHRMVCAARYSAVKIYKASPYPVPTGKYKR